ncbi:hypothetical protein BT96DRAFT_921672 [Gymnopus androsaceus JB14]|uniref:Uncharacterized protein n=1 Tax=Gymnopus androsaceus JB14 TaxID=1447944 RepID=A0A6A4HF95_9AGAR|nr:hypothetical protein BT96DRAFT_921672 [Gymnopus androsaceus JB14]
MVYNVLPELEKRSKLWRHVWGNVRYHIQAKNLFNTQDSVVFVLRVPEHFPNNRHGLQKGNCLTTSGNPPSPVFEIFTTCCQHRKSRDFEDSSDKRESGR